MFATCFPLYCPLCFPLYCPLYRYALCSFNPPPPSNLMLGTSPSGPPPGGGHGIFTTATASLGPHHPLGSGVVAFDLTLGGEMAHPLTSALNPQPHNRAEDPALGNGLHQVLPDCCMGKMFFQWIGVPV